METLDIPDFLRKPENVKRDSLQEQGFRFIGRAGRFFWCHPAEIRSADIDCTDMDDDEFAETILTHNAKGELTGSPKLQ